MSTYMTKSILSHNSIKRSFKCKLALIGIVTFTYSQNISAQGVKEDNQSFDSIPNQYNLKFQDRSINLWRKITKEEYKTRATSTIYSQDIVTSPNSDITQAITGRASGLFSQQNSGRAGADFSAASMSIRGQSPIILIDGIIRPFTNISLADIESITIQKDALTTAMNGQLSSAPAIYITTRSQSNQHPFEINFNLQQGFLEDLKKPKFLDAYQYASLYNEAQKNTIPNSIPRFNSTQLEAYRNDTNNPYSQPYVRWYDLIHKDNSRQQKYNLNVAGKGESFKYFASAEYFNQGGNFITDKQNPYNTNNDYDRYNLRTNAEVKFNKTISLDVNIFGSFEKYNEPGAGASSIMNRVFFLPQTEYPSRNEDGSFSGVTKWLQNPLANVINSGYIQTSKRSINSDATLKFNLDDILEGLWADARISFNNFYAENVNRTKTTAIFVPTFNSNGTVSYIQNGTESKIEPGKGVSNVSTQFNQNYLGATIGYNKNWELSSLKTRLVFNNYKNSDSYTLLDKVYKTIGLEANYILNDKYLADLTLTNSSLNRYQPGTQWAFSPAAALGWIISKEDWFKNQNFINFLKIRASAGQTTWSGNVGYFNYLPSFSINTDGYNFGATPGSVSGSTENILANPDIKWEKALKFDIGFDAAFLNNKINLSLDYYQDKYKDLLTKQYAGRNSGIIGQDIPFENLGKKSYTGLEATLGYRSNQNKDFKYFLNANFNLAQSKNTFTAEGNLPYTWMYNQGQPVGTAYGYDFSNFFTGTETSPIATIPGYTLKPGDLVYKDLNQDGVINDFDKTNVTGNKPKLFYGINFGFSYKGFDINALLQGVNNSRTMLSGLYMSAFNNASGYVLDYTTENRWTPDNQNADLPRLTLGPNANNQVNSSFWVKNTDYIRLKNLEIGYTFPESLTNKIQVKKLRLFVNGYNLWTNSKLKHMDPESLMSAFPNQRIVNGGFSFQL